MAGGQERVLRRRIKTVQSTKKITKAMELIAASRIVKAQQRVAAARPYSERITEVIRNLAAGGAGLNLRSCSQRDDIRTVAYVVDRGRPRPCRRLQHQRHPCHRARHAGRSRGRSRDEAVSSSARRRRPTSASAARPSRRPSSASPTSRPTSTPARSRTPSRPRSGTEKSTRSSSCTRSSCPPGRSGSSSGA